MIWGMYLPRGGGPYGPDGDYEGPVDIDGDGWLHRLIKYGCEELSDEQRAFYGDGRRYAFCAIKKFHKENGYRGPSPDDRIVQPIEKHEPPLFFQLKRGYRELSSIISLPGRIWAVDESVKQIIERLEPSLHSFYPVEIRMRRGKVYPVQYYVLVVGKYLESFSPEESQRTSMARARSGRMADLSFRRTRICSQRGKTQATQILSHDRSLIENRLNGRGRQTLLFCRQSHESAHG